MLSDALNAKDLIAFHDRALAEWETVSEASPAWLDHGLWHWIERGHWCNVSLWREEETAEAARYEGGRTTAETQRRLLDYRRERWDALKQIDETLAQAAGPGAGAGTPDETPGALIDRLSLLAVQIFHAGKQTLRRDVSEAALARCTAELEHLIEERRALGERLDALLRTAKVRPDAPGPRRRWASRAGVMAQVGALRSIAARTAAAGAMPALAGRPGPL